MSTREELLANIDSDFQKIQSARPLSKTELLELRKSLGVMFTYSSNAIEGNTLTLWETKLVLEDGLTVGWKTLREISEASNHKNALTFLYNFLESGGDIDESTIQQVHRLLLQNIDDQNAWEYRKIQCYISWDEYTPPEAKEVPALMKNLIVWCKKNNGIMHPAYL